MAVGDGTLPDLFPVDGIRLGTGCAGIKQEGRLDLLIIELAENTNIACSFTRNAFCAAPVQIAKQHSQSILPTRYLLVNTGNANAGTGEQGLQACLSNCEALAQAAGVEIQQVLPFSTGVIGEALPVEKINQHIPEVLASLNLNGWQKAARGIMTTDTRPKAATRRIDVQGESVTVTGIAKGAGMIRPNMATMLAYIASDADIEQDELQKMLGLAIEQSFNRITIDGDTSTNDACVLMATGQTQAKLSKAYKKQLQQAINEVCIELAQGLIKDGEGATKFVSVEIVGGRTEEECLKLAFTIAESPLVKTALFASDPNWGRLLAAIGRAELDELDVNKVIIHINDVLIAEQGCRAESYSEEAGQAAMEKEAIHIRVDLQRGEQEATVWTSDLSYDYVKINAEYRT